MVPGFPPAVPSHGSSLTSQACVSQHASPTQAWGPIRPLRLRPQLLAAPVDTAGVNPRAALDLDLRTDRRLSFLRVFRAKWMLPSLLFSHQPQPPDLRRTLPHFRKEEVLERRFVVCLFLFVADPALSCLLAYLGEPSSFLQQRGSRETYSLQSDFSQKTAWMAFSYAFTHTPNNGPIFLK